MKGRSQEFRELTEAAVARPEGGSPPEGSLQARPETRASHVPGRVSRSRRLAHFLFQKVLQAKREWIRRS